jgi:hypothetical protein
MISPGLQQITVPKSPHHSLAIRVRGDVEGYPTRSQLEEYINESL